MNNNLYAFQLTSTLSSISKGPKTLCYSVYHSVPLCVTFVMHKLGNGSYQLYTRSISACILGTARTLSC